MHIYYQRLRRYRYNHNIRALVQLVRTLHLVTVMQPPIIKKRFRKWLVSTQGSIPCAERCRGRQFESAVLDNVF